MKPKDNRAILAEWKKTLPPELWFAAEVPNFDAMDADDMHVWGKKYFAFLRKNAVRLREYDMDVEETIAYLEPELRGLEEDQRKIEKALEEYCNLQAGLANADYAAFKRFEKLVTKALKDKPYCPKVQEGKRILDEWRKHMPKE